MCLQNINLTELLLKDIFLTFKKNGYIILNQAEDNVENKRSFNSLYSKALKKSSFIQHGRIKDR